MRLLVLLIVALFAAACGPAGSGACIKDLSGRSYDYCLNFHDTTEKTGEKICTDQTGSWTAGTTCQALGYTKECRPNSWFQPSSTCI